MGLCPGRPLRLTWLGGLGFEVTGVASNLEPTGALGGLRDLSL